MSVLLIGAIALLAALRARRLDGWSGVAASGWIGVIAALALLQLWVARDDIARYRFTLLGLRYAAADAGGAPREEPLRISGDYDSADLYVPGAGERAAAELRALGDTAIGSVVAHRLDDAGALVLVRVPGRFGTSSWRLLGGVPLSTGDTIAVRGGGERRLLTVGRVMGQLPAFGGSLPLPWTHVPALTVLRDDGATATGTVALPAPRQGLVRELRGARPSIFARTYPLADVLAAADSAAARGLPPLTSFLYYEDGRLALADLDGEVEVVGAAAASADLTLWSRAEGGRRLMIAAPPLRDYPELDLTLPERYGVRPLRTLVPAVHGGWLDLTFTEPEIQAYDRAGLAALSLPRRDDHDAFRLRLSHARNSQVREAVVFDAPPLTFAAASQALLALPADPRAGSFEVLTPSGLARWSTGHPLPLGAGDRALLLRVDGAGTSAAFWLVLIGLFLMAGSVVHFRRLAPVVTALCIAATGFAALRLLLGLSAMLEFPYVREAHQIGLWLLPVLPWCVAVAWETGRALRGQDAGGGPVFHAIFGATVIALALVLFRDAPAKAAALSLVPAVLFAVRMAAASPALRRAAADRMARLRPRARLLRLSRAGWALGLGLLLFRVLLDLIGWREGIMVGGTRLAISVLFTPLALLALARVLRAHGVSIERAPGAAEHNRRLATALLDTGAFVTLAFVAVGFWISDFGIPLVTLPGVLVLVASLGAWWASRGTFGRVTAAAFALPLLLFALVQAAPGLLSPVWHGDASAADLRMDEWNRNELLLLERGDPGALRLIGQRRSEALAVMRETMRSYTRGNILGKGFLQGRVSNEIADTATREHVVSALLAAQFGLTGTLGLVCLLLALLAPATSAPDTGPRPIGAPPWWSMAQDPEPSERRWIDVAVLGAGLLAVALVLPPPFNLTAVLLIALAIAVPAVLPALAVPGAPRPGVRARARNQDRAGPALRRGGAPGGSTFPEDGSHQRVAPDDASAERPGNLTPSFARLAATALLFALAFAGLYMVLANYGLVFFTGKNVYLLGLDSVSDALEGLALLGGAALALGLERAAPLAPALEAPAAPPALAGRREQPMLVSP